MADFLNSWGGLIGLIGALLSLFGLAASIWAVYCAGKAREAAEAARRETRVALTRALATVELERAIALVQRLKELHRDNRREAGLVLYPILRVMLVDISFHHTESTAESQELLQRAIMQITEMEDRLGASTGDDADFREFSVKLNALQVNLENLASDIQLPNG